MTFLIIFDLIRSIISRFKKIQKKLFSGSPQSSSGADKRTLKISEAKVENLKTKITENTFLHPWSPCLHYIKFAIHLCFLREKQNTTK